MKLFRIMFLVSLFSSSWAFAEGNWADKISLGGDFRYRHEYADQELTDAANHRQRMRARLKLEGEVNDETKVVLQLASGGTSATSTNETFDGGYGNKAIDIDMAYVNWKASDKATLLAGKVKNTFFAPGESEILFDSDLTPEGLAVNWASKSEDSNSYFANLASYWFDERNADETTASQSDILQYSAQLGVVFPVQTHKITLGASYHTFAPIQGRAPFSASGNTLTGSNYENEYQISEILLVYDSKIAERDFQFYGELISNSGASEENQAYILGLNLGKAKEAGEWSFGYNYRVVEADAVLSAIDDADFAKGETDNRGHKVQFKYQMAKNAQASLAYLKSERSVQVGTKTEYDLAQLDFIFKF